MNGIEKDKINLDIEIVKMTIESLKINICGFWGVPAELLKSGSKKLYELLREIFERCLNGKEVANDWKIGRISAIHKKRKQGRIWKVQRNYSIEYF
jgi:hypothetical protein